MYLTPKAIHFEFKGNNHKPTDFHQHRWQIAGRVQELVPNLIGLSDEDRNKIEDFLDKEVRPNLATGTILIFKP